jgi:multiple sugar transport system substrate-binding protein
VRTQKSRPWWAAIALIAAVAVACSSAATTAPTSAPGSQPAPSTGTEPSAAASSVSLRVTTWTSNEGHLKLLNGLADDYRASHPEVQSIKFDSIPYDDYVTTVATQLAGGNPPDLGWLVDASARDFANAGALLDVAPTLAATADYDVADLSANAMGLWVDGAKTYGVPFSTSPFGVYYNADMFTAAGLKTPDELVASGGWTWDALRAAAKTIKEKTGKFGYVVPDIFDYQLWDYLVQVWRGFGADPWSADGKQCTMDQPAMVQAMTFYHDMVYVDKSVPGPGVAADFFAEETGMGSTQLSSSARLKDVSWKWGVVGLPTGPAGNNQVFGQAAFVVFSASKNQEAAASFLAYLTSKTGVAKLAQFFPPARTSLLTKEVLSQANKILTPDQLDALVIQGIAHGKILATHTNFARIQDTARQALEPLWQPNADVQATLTAVCTAIQPLLDQ